jgi:TolB protein
MEDTSIRIGLPADEDASISDLLTDALAEFPTEVETLNEGTISIASQTWTSTQIRFEDENLGGQGIATIAVTNKDGQGYYLIAVAPAEAWNLVQPLFQAMINSFKFGAEETVAQAPTKTTLQSTRAMTPEEDETKEGDETEESETQAEADSISTPTPKATPTPKQTATPLVYRVKSGDTLLGIAVKFGVDMELLAQENGIESPESLQVDQELTIPFTAEELAAYNAGISGDSVATDNEAQNETGTSETSSTEAETAAAEAPAAPQPAAKEEAPAQPAAAPVSGRIVYPAFNPNVNSYDIWMVDLATGEQTPIAGNASQPAFNRDGTLLAYRSWELSTRGIFFRDFVGGRGGMVTRFVEDGLPAWAPDGYSFAFASRKEGDRVPRIYIGNQLGEDTFSVGFQGEYADTFPDGRLVVKGCTPTGDCGMFVIGSRGGSETKISGEPADTAPAVSPDGGRVAFMSSGRGASNWEIWVMNANGSNAKRLTENGNNDGLPAWSPDGKSIAYVSDQGGAWAVWVMNADGSNQRKLFSMKGSPDGKVLHDEPNSRGWLEERISWAP